MCTPGARPARYFYYDFPRFSPQVHHYPMKPWPYREVFHDSPQPLKAGIIASTSSEFLGIWLFCRRCLHPAACYCTRERSTKCAVPLWRSHGSQLCCGLPSVAHALCMGQGYLSLRGATGALGGGGGGSEKANRLTGVLEGGLGLGNVMTFMLGVTANGASINKGGPKELLERRQLRELMGMVVETRDHGYQRRWSIHD